MACMCGDICCWSCGPAQGNTRCYVCGAWDSDGGCKNPEECDRIAEKNAIAEAAYNDKMAEEMDRADVETGYIEEF